VTSAAYRETVLDAGTRRVAKVYAEALINAAEKHGRGDSVVEELDTLVDDVFRSQPDLERFLSSAAVRRDQKARVIGAAFEHKTDPLFVDFLRVLNKHDRLGVIRAIRSICHEIRDQRARRVRVKVRSAVPLDDGQLDRIRHDLRSTFSLEPLLESTVDAALLGGVVIQVGDWLFDGSVRTRLSRLRDQLLARSSYEIQRRRDQFSN
jgi:F-type H+-transporting ATPase subunit delta